MIHRALLCIALVGCAECARYETHTEHRDGYLQCWGNEYQPVMPRGATSACLWHGGIPIDVPPREEPVQTCVEYVRSGGAR